MMNPASRWNSAFESMWVKAEINMRWYIIEIEFFKKKVKRLNCN
ncbi:hypothetical protein SAMN06298216_3560 [Spirosomataceae bacterium TFI 002]|nr:hypothetical protein SAMN06298216_3560 [Spirosomataceae bacterium TFI 002]